MLLPQNTNRTRPSPLGRGRQSEQSEVAGVGCPIPQAHPP